MSRSRAYLQLLRVPSIFTAVSNFWAGAFVSSDGDPQVSTLLAGAVSAASLYGGGVALNDYADREEDERLRPERPIPSGMVSPKTALLLSTSLLTGGTLVALTISPTVASVFAAVALFAILYDTLLKNWLITALVSMSLCRALNWTAGLLTTSAFNYEMLVYPAVIFVYTAAITTVARSKLKKRIASKMVTTGVMLFPLMDGTMVALSGLPLQGLLVASLMLPAVTLLVFFKVD